MDSARITELGAAVERGEPHCESAFWRRVEREGAPIVEPVPGDDEHRLLTFVWRGGAHTRGVAIVGGIVGNQYGELTRLTGTDVWYGTYVAPVSLRTSYQLLENPSWLGRDANTLSAEDHVAIPAEPWCIDPLNPRRFERPLMPVTSMVELEAAPAQPWIVERAEAPHGRMEPHRWSSELLQSDRVVWTYLPPGYDESAAHYPPVLLFDGYAYLQMDIQHTLDNLIHAGHIRPAVVAMLNPIDRMKELACDPAFTDAVADELLARWLPGRYRVAGAAVVGGASLGGLAAAFAALRRPDVFGAGVISQSGSYWWGPGATLPAHTSDKSVHWQWLTDEYAKSAAPRRRWYMDVGALERPAEGTDGPDMVAVNRRVRDVLRANGHDVAYSEFAGGHDYVCWRGTLADALQALLPA